MDTIRGYFTSHSPGDVKYFCNKMNTVMETFLMLIYFVFNVISITWSNKLYLTIFFFFFLVKQMCPTNLIVQKLGIVGGKDQTDVKTQRLEYIFHVFPCIWFGVFQQWNPICKQGNIFCKLYHWLPVINLVIK